MICAGNGVGGIATTMGECTYTITRLQVGALRPYGHDHPRHLEPRYGGSILRWGVQTHSLQ